MKGFLNDYGMVWVGEPEAEAELAAHGYGPTGAATGGAGAGPSSGGGHLQPLSAEPSDAGAPRRRSHSGASAGPLSAGAGGPTPVGPGVGRMLGGGSRSHGPGQAGGLSSAAAAALSRAGGGHAAGEEAAAAGPSSASAAAVPAAPAAALAKRSSSFTGNWAATAHAGHAGQPAPLAGPGPGPTSSASSNSPKGAPPAGGGGAGPGPSRPPLPVSLSALQGKVDELNDLAGDGCGQIVKDGAGQHVLATRDPVNLVIYRDGLQIHVLPAKPFNDPASANVIRDIMDGYFPYVLKRDFPDGVPLRVVDRTHDSIDSSPSRRPGPSGGAAGAGGGAAPRAGAGGNVRTWDDIDVAGGAAGGPTPESRDKFLSRLPQAVIKNGKVIEIRSDISKMMGGPGSGSGHEAGKGDVALVSTPVDALLSTMQRNHVGPSLPPPSRDGLPPATEVTTLQVRTGAGAWPCLCACVVLPGASAYTRWLVRSYRTPNTVQHSQQHPHDA